MKLYEQKFTISYPTQLLTKNKFFEFNEFELKQVVQK